jgi:tyrosine-protein phosphatase YwqE
MLSFFKSKPYLKDLLGSHFIDIHSHILPGIDDGAKDISKSIELVKAFQELGISQIITTPHISHYVWNNSPEIIQNKLIETRNSLEEKKINTPIRAAAEYFMDDWFENHFKNEKLLTLKDNYVLVEISYQSPPINLHKIIFDLKVAGYVPVLAHPERYIYFHKNLDEYGKLKNLGCLFQLNLLATIGYYGSKAAKTADELLKKGMYDFCGTDIHHRKHIEAFQEKVKIENTSVLNEIISNNQFFKI